MTDNNYTSGYTSEIHFTNLFVNPNIAGPITFIADIESELGDIISVIDSSIIIICPQTNINEIKKDKKLLKIVDILGKNLNKNNNTVLFYIYSDGTVEKKIIN